tara:strand:- start:193 stop:339 length:147 start_codon:yes stop_codon:yes gene_type:complete
VDLNFVMLHMAQRLRPGSGRGGGMEDLTKKLTPKKRKAIEALLTQPDP